MNFKSIWVQIDLFLKIMWSTKINITARTLEDVEFIFEFEIFIHHPHSKTSLCSNVILHESVDAFRDLEFTFELYSLLL